MFNPIDSLYLTNLLIYDSLYSVEAKLAKRRARVAMLREKQEMELVAKGDISDKELEKMEKDHVCTTNQLTLQP